MYERISISEFCFHAMRLEHHHYFIDLINIENVALQFCPESSNLCIIVVDIIYSAWPTIILIQANNTHRHTFDTFKRIRSDVSITIHRSAISRISRCAISVSSSMTDDSICWALISHVTFAPTLDLGTAPDCVCKNIQCSVWFGFDSQLELQ